MSILAGLLARSEQRSPFYPGDWGYFNYNGVSYPYGLNQTLAGAEEQIETNFQGFVQGVYKANGVVASCMLARRHVFSQLRFQWQQLRGGQPGRLFGTEALASLERPWPGGTTSDLLAKMLDHADLGGNAYGVRNRYGSTRLLRPDWCTLVMGSRESGDIDPNDPDAELVGLMYAPPQAEPKVYRVGEFVHFAPEPDPIANYRGMSWLTPVLRNVSAHNAAAIHKSKFFTNGATPNMVLSWDASVALEKVKAFKDLFEEKHQGLANAYRTMFLGGGADVTVVGQDFKQLDFKTVQGTDETLIAAAAGVPPVIAGLSEGLAAATYSNYGQAKRQFGDTTIYHLGQNVCASLEALVPPPDENTRLWFDTNTPFFRDDAKAEADVRYRDSQTLRNYIDAGWEPETAKQAVLSGDISQLSHTGLFSVQLQRPGTERQITVSAQAAIELVAEGWEIVPNRSEPVDALTANQET